jgi:hypothetical protein
MKSAIQKSKTFKELLIFLIFLSILTSALIVSAAPTINIDPAKPKPKETIDITVAITDVTPTSVHFLIQECEGTSLCHQIENITLTETSSNVYTGSFSLQYAKATYMQYTLNVQTASGWTQYDENTKVNLDLSTTSDGNGSNDSPGFEFIIMALSIIFISFILYRRSR